MDDDRQKAFQRLKPPCVNLSTVALKFRTNEVAIKEVLKALETVKETITDLGKADQLDSRLAEYAFFPLAQQVFNESRRLSPRCLETAADCVTLLVQYGYRSTLQPELGKQLLILMSMLAGAGPNAPAQQPSEELQTSAFRCISTITKALSSSKEGSTIFDDQGMKNVVDQLVYLLLEAVATTQSDTAQLSASEALIDIIEVIRNRVFLASLLPRTVSSLTKVLLPSTKLKRTQKMLVVNIKSIRKIIRNTLSDSIALNCQNEAEKEALGTSWLGATTTQIKSALAQICKLRIHENPRVRRALEEFCAVLIECCSKTLASSIPIVMETLLVLSASSDGQSALATTRHIVVTYPETGEMLRTSLSNWMQSLPRVLSGQDERPKELVLQKITAALPLVAESMTSTTAGYLDSIPLLLGGISSIVSDTSHKTFELQDHSVSLDTMLSPGVPRQRDFDIVLLNHQSQRLTTEQMYRLIEVLRDVPEHLSIARQLNDIVADSEGVSKLSAMWLSLQLLRKKGSQSFDMGDLIVSDNAVDLSLSRSTLLADLNAMALPMLSSVYNEGAIEDSSHWKFQALAMELIVAYAETFPADTYRPELMDSLYPVLSFLGSPNAMLRSHAMVALDKLSTICQYSNTQELLIANVDYLVNSIAWKLNTYSLSPEAPQLLRMMIHLCGAELIPYLDDLTQSTFAALDAFHGYPEWVENLFSTLKAMVDVSMKQPHLAITHGGKIPKHQKSTKTASKTSDILSDLQARKRRKLDFGRSAEERPSAAPHRPWTDTLDGPSFPKPPENEEDNASQNDQDEHLSPMKQSEDEKEPKLSKSHDLLLSIATSTVPHLTSPSPNVRLLLLNLLNDVTPLLSRDENSFLPLINAIWPVLVPRLFAEQRENEEAAFNIAAAANGIATLCSNAGDFMSSRIEDIAEQLTKTFRRTVKELDLAKTKSKQDAQVNGNPFSRSPMGVISGTVSLSVVSADSATTPNVNTAITHRQSTRTSASQIFDALIGLLLAILDHVTLSLDTSDGFMTLLLPLMSYKAAIQPVLENYNSDAVWLYHHRQRVRASKEIFMQYEDSESPVKTPSAVTGRSSSEEHVPKLRNSLLQAGVRLAAVGRKPSH